MPASQTIDWPVIVLVGPTAVGKTTLSLQLAHRFNCEIVSMDSMQVYRYMDIGTAKPGPDELGLVPHHLIDIREPDEQYDAAEFVRDALAALESIGRKNKVTLLTGGTGLYQKALFEGLFTALPVDPEIRRNLQLRLEKEGREVLHAELCTIDPEAGARIHPNDRQRLLRGLEIYLSCGRTWSELLQEQRKQGQQKIRFTSVYQVALGRPRQELYSRIERRTRIMLDQGLIQEVVKLRSMGFGPDLSAMQSIGYRHVNMLLSGQWSRETMLEKLVRDTRRYAKRQLTWFGNNKDLHWYSPGKDQAIAEDIEKNLSL
jgi:tRNA dimethylallyltransferase